MEKNILISIISSYKHTKSRLKYLFDTWYKDSENVIILSDHEDKDNNIFKISDDSSYGSNVDKNFNSYKFLRENYPNYDFYLVLDDDTFLNYNNLKTEIQKYDTNNIYMLGFINEGTLPLDGSLNYCSGGAGCIFNKKTLDILSEVDNTYRRSKFADANVGFFCRDRGIKIINNEKFHPREPEYYNYDDKQIKEAVTFHYIKGDDFYKINKIIKNG